MVGRAAADEDDNGDSGGRGLRNKHWSQVSFSVGRSRCINAVGRQTDRPARFLYRCQEQSNPGRHAFTFRGGWCSLRAQECLREVFVERTAVYVCACASVEVLYMGLKPVCSPEDEQTTAVEPILEGTREGRGNKKNKLERKKVVTGVKKRGQKKKDKGWKSSGVGNTESQFKERVRETKKRGGREKRRTNKLKHLFLVSVPFFPPYIVPILFSIRIFLVSNGNCEIFQHTV